MEPAIEYRQQKHNKEQPYALLAINNLARVKSALGFNQRAKHLIPPIEVHNINENDFGTLASRIHWLRYFFE